MSRVEHVELRDGELRLRPPRREEAALYAGWWQDEEACFGFCCEARSVEEIEAAFPELEAEAADIGHWIDFVLEVGGRPAGYVWLARWDLDASECEMNVLIGERDLRRRGYGRRAVRLLGAWAFAKMGLHRLLLCPRDDHLPAIRSYLAAGARLGEVREETVSWRGETVCFREIYFLPEDFGLEPAPALSGATGSDA